MNKNEPQFEVTPISPESKAKVIWLKVKVLFDRPDFLRWAAISSIVVALGSFAAVWVLTSQVKNLQKVISVHDQVLEKVVKGELPLLQLEDKTFTPAVPYSIRLIRELQQLTNQLKERAGAKPTPTPSRFGL